MAQQRFYWIGSTAANVSSLNWTEQSNWSVLQYPSTNEAGVVATIVPATRFPIGGDEIYFGHITDSVSYQVPTKQTIYSPLLFGGVSASGSAIGNVWYGSTAGSTTVERYGSCHITVHPNYPFSQIGGYLNTTILNEWASKSNYNGTWSLTSGVAGSTGAIFLNPEWGVTGITITVNVIDPSSGFTTGATAEEASTEGITFQIERPSNALNDTYIKVIGSVIDSAAELTTCYFSGVTGSTAGATGAVYDGSNNIYYRQTGIVRESGTAQNTETLKEGGASFLAAIPTASSSHYSHGDLHLNGVWNTVVQQNNTLGGDIFFENTNINFINLSPNSGFVNSGNAYPNNTSSIINTSDTSGFAVDIIVLDRTSSCKQFLLGAVGSVGSLKSIDQLIIHGDIKTTGGFTCTNVAGTTDGALIPSGTLWLTPPVNQTLTPVCSISTISAAVTTINNIYSNSGSGPEWQILFNGSSSIGKIYSYGGTIQPSSEFPINSVLGISNIFAFGTSVVDFSPTISATGFTGSILCGSKDARILTRSGNIVTIANA